MTYNKKLGALALLASTSAIILAACSSEAPAAKLVGSKVDDYMLVDQTGMGHILKYDTITPAVVLVSHVNGDAGSLKAAKAIQDLAAKNPNVVFQLINSSDADTRQSIAEEAKASGLTIPILDDEYQLIGNSLGFTYAGEAVIVDPKKNFEIVYHGPADTIETALTDVVAGKAPATAAGTTNPAGAHSTAKSIRGEMAITCAGTAAPPSPRRSSTDTPAWRTTCALVTSATPSQAGLASATAAPRLTPLACTLTRLSAAIRRAGVEAACSAGMPAQPAKTARNMERAKRSSTARQPSAGEGRHYPKPRIIIPLWRLGAAINAAGRKIPAAGRHTPPPAPRPTPRAHGCIAGG
jgi:hypothetical protein